MFPLIEANVGQCFTFVCMKKTDRERTNKYPFNAENDDRKAELPTLTSGANNHHTHELEMTTNKLIVAIRE